MQDSYAELTLTIQFNQTVAAFKDRHPLPLATEYILPRLQACTLSVLPQQDTVVTVDVDKGRQSWIQLEHCLGPKNQEAINLEQSFLKRWSRICTGRG